MVMVVFDYLMFLMDWKIIIGKKYVKKCVMVDKLSMVYKCKVVSICYFFNLVNIKLCYMYVL